MPNGDDAMMDVSSGEEEEDCLAAAPHPLVLEDRLAMTSFWAQPNPHISLDRNLDVGWPEAKRRWQK